MWCESSSVQSPVVYKLRHSFRIEKFSDLLDTYPTGQMIRSACFADNQSDKGSQFFINLYPAGSKPEFSEWLSVFVHLREPSVQHQSSPVSNPSGLMAKEKPRFCSIRFSLTDPSEQERFVRTATHTLSIGSVNLEKANWGYRRFCRRSEVKDYLNYDGSVTLTCSLTVALPCESPAEVLPYFSEEKAHQMWKDSFTKTDSPPDLKIIVSHGSEKEEFRLHKHILAAQSAVFEKMINSEMMEGSRSCVEIKDVCPDVFRSFVTFLYSGCCSSNLDFSSDLLKLGDKYGIECLTKLCESRIVQKMNSENLVAIMTKLAPLNVTAIDRKAAEIVRNEWKTISKSQAWKDLSTASPEFAFSLLEKVMTCCLNQ